MWYDTTLGARYSTSSVQGLANADEIYLYFTGLSTPWHVNSISALCGNIQQESSMNPYIRESTASGAFGLVQWISYKSAMIAWANNNGLRPTSGPAQVRYLEYERSINEQWLMRSPTDTVSFNDFAYNTGNWTVDYLTYVFWNNFERSSGYNSVRAEYAADYYEHFTGSPPTPGPGVVPLWLLFRRRPWWKPGGRKWIIT